MDYYLYNNHDFDHGIYLNGMERNDQYTTINAKSREAKGVSKCSELPCKCILVTKMSLPLSHKVSSLRTKETLLDV